MKQPPVTRSLHYEFIERERERERERDREAVTNFPGLKSLPRTASPARIRSWRTTRRTTRTGSPSEEKRSAFFLRTRTRAPERGPDEGHCGGRVSSFRMVYDQPRAICQVDEAIYI